MILEIKLNNISTYKDTVSFQMEASESADKKNNYSKDGVGNNVLNSCIIYGANSSGKTKFILTIYKFLQELKNVAPSNGIAIYDPFLLDTETRDMPSVFSIRFSMLDKEFLYLIEFNGTEYQQEELKEKRGDEWVLIYNRIPAKSQHKVEFSEYANPNRFKTIAKNKMVLSQYLAFTDDIVGDVARYLSNIQTANGYNDHMREILWQQVKQWINENRKKRGEQLQGFLNALDISVSNFSFPQKDDASFDDIKFKHKLWKGDTETDQQTEFNINLESQGTKWLLLIGAKVIHSLENGFPLFIDELDSSFHTEATRFIIDLYQDPEINKKKAQLILTTHNIYLMDENKMRNDQIWFIQKNEKGISEMYSIFDFEDVPNNIHFSDWYMAKRFGATPNIGSIRNILNKK